MKSTGEVMGISENFGISFAKAQLASHNPIPAEGKQLFMSLTDLDKPAGVDLAKEFVALGYEIVATAGTARTLNEAGVAAKSVLKVSEGRPNVVDLFKNKSVDLAINTSDNKRSKDDAKQLRQAVLSSKIPYFTTLAAVRAALEAIGQIKAGKSLSPRALQSYLNL